MSLNKIVLSGIRNLQPLSIDISAECSIFTGSNGSGKTSLIESIYLLSRGASFRTTNLSGLINHNMDELRCFGEIKQDGLAKVGIERSRATKSTKLRLNGSKPKTLSDIASVFPTLLITPYTFQLIEGGPKERRKLLDWGLFHVEPSYRKQWSNWQKVLLQRNKLLKSGNITSAELNSWDYQFLEYSKAITNHRQKYFDLLYKKVREITLSENRDSIGSMFIKEIVEQTSFDFYQGWPGKKTIEEVTKTNFDLDRRSGSTNYGPHRADIYIKSHGIQAAEVLSRGQLKVLIANILLAQLRIVREDGLKNCTVLIDDIGAELDKNNQIDLLKCILGEKAQVIVTVLDEDHARVIRDKLSDRYVVNMFHVKHGQINRAL